MLTSILKGGFTTFAFCMISVISISSHMWTSVIYDVVEPQLELLNCTSVYDIHEDFWTSSVMALAYFSTYISSWGLIYHTYSRIFLLSTRDSIQHDLKLKRFITRQLSVSLSLVICAIWVVTTIMTYGPSGLLTSTGLLYNTSPLVLNLIDMKTRAFTDLNLYNGTGTKLFYLNTLIFTSLYMLWVVCYFKFLNMDVIDMEGETYESPYDIMKFNTLRDWLITSGLFIGTNSAIMISGKIIDKFSLI